MIVTDLCVPAKQASKSWSYDPSLLSKTEQKQGVEAFCYLLRAFVMVHGFPFLNDPPSIINLKSAWGQLVDATGHYLNSLGSWGISLLYFNNHEKKIVLGLLFPLFLPQLTLTLETKAFLQTRGR